MCGIAGFWQPGPAPAEQLRDSALAMASQLARRGPDGEGVLAFAEDGLALSHRRLAVLGLGDGGAQPMASGCGRYALTYNGEIYNYQALALELQSLGERIQGGSDTEVLLAGLRVWGVEGCVARLIGMFAFAFFDGVEKRLWLVRDRLGIKPLYWGQMAGKLVFCSDLQALRPLDGWPLPIDQGALGAYVRHGYVPAPASIFEGISKLAPGHILKFDSATSEGQENSYWSLSDLATGPREARSDEEALEELSALVDQVVADRLVSDVPLGAFLSGGIDSSLVVSAMAQRAPEQVRTFSIGFDDPAFDESKFSGRFAKHFSCNHNELIVSSDDLLQVIPDLPELYSEPFADSSQVPTAILSRFTREHVTVALSGDGGDELFGGYERHRLAPAIWAKAERFSPSIRKAGGAMLSAIPDGFWSAGAALFPESKRPRLLAEKINKVAPLLGAADLDDLYRGLTSLWLNPDQVVRSGQERKGVLWRDEAISGLSPVDRMRYLDAMTYLPDDILTKVDRATMGFGLEARVPLLDHRLVAFAWSLQPNHVVRGGKGKWLLREALAKRLPPEQFERPKMGFALPFGDWLRGPLRDWVEDLISERALVEAGLFNPTVVRRAWSEHLTGRRDRRHQLWCILMAQAWQAALKP
ncbi:MAG: asparagine synthase (glutamine-hydrolyzing) [Magnetovibrionaceae bacterium]